MRSPKQANILPPTFQLSSSVRARAAVAPGSAAQNSVDKGAAMRPLDWLESWLISNAREEAFRDAAAEGLAVVPPFHRELACAYACSSDLWLVSCSECGSLISIPFTCRSAVARASAGRLSARDALRGLENPHRRRCVDIGRLRQTSPVEAGRLAEARNRPTPLPKVWRCGVPVARRRANYGPGADRMWR